MIQITQNISIHETICVFFRSFYFDISSTFWCYISYSFMSRDRRVIRNVDSFFVCVSNNFEWLLIDVICLWPKKEGKITTTTKTSIKSKMESFMGFIQSIYLLNETEKAICVAKLLRCCPMECWKCLHLPKPNLPLNTVSDDILFFSLFLVSLPSVSARKLNYLYCIRKKRTVILSASCVCLSFSRAYVCLLDIIELETKHLGLQNNPIEECWRSCDFFFVFFFGFVLLYPSCR